MLSRLLKSFTASSPSAKMANFKKDLIYTEYKSNPVDIPDDFLTGPAAEPVTLNPVPFSTSPVPEYAKCNAWILDNVLSREECAQLIAYAEASAVLNDEGDSPWRPALVSVAPGVEAAAPGYRHSDRIIWDNQLLVDRLWGRCDQAKGLQELVATGPWYKPVDAHVKDGEWVFARLNERMRFLKYGPGMFFKPHCDASYRTKENNAIIETYYTVHLYLSDEGLVGGATGFLSRDRERRLDVNPKAGSVLIFQHPQLFHEGAEVKEGTKYTMRTEIMYRWQQFEPDTESK